VRYCRQQPLRRWSADPAGAEGAAFAFDHQHPDFIRRLDLQAELLEFFRDRKIDRVEGSGPVERDGGDRTSIRSNAGSSGRELAGVISCRHCKEPPVSRTMPGS